MTANSKDSLVDTFSRLVSLCCVFALGTSDGRSVILCTFSMASSGGRLQGKVRIITGSSSGLGRAIALAYSREGGHLVCTDLQPAARKIKSEETVIDTDELIRQNGGRAIFVKTDVGIANEMKMLVDKAAAEFGRVDVYCQPPLLPVM